jgi:Flp pilus assembly protein TadG
MSRSLVAKVIYRWSVLLRNTEAAELIEFAVSLPLLVVFMVGIFDFSSAFVLKQNIAHVAAEAARITANQPMSDVANPGSCPVSICAVRDVVDRALTNNGIPDCGLSGATPVGPAGLAWTFSANSCSAGSLTLTIDRGYTYTTNLAAPFQAPYTIEATKVTLSYPHQWQFDKVITLILPGANYANSPVQSVAIMQNLN